MAEQLSDSLETLYPAPAEVLDEFARVRERFLSEFDLDDDPETSTISAYLSRHDLYSHPTISIPYTSKDYAAALAIASETELPIPFLLQLFNPATDFEEVNRPGFAFSTPAYRLNVVSDISEQCALLYGETYTKRIMSNTRAHEISHSVFHAKPEILVGNNEDGQLDGIYETYPLSGMVHPISGSKESYTLTPNWAEEAFAVYVSSDVFKQSIPEGPGYSTSCVHWGPSKFWLDEHYLVRVEEFPDSPGFVSGAVSGQALELLDQHVPGTIDAMYGIARGEVDGQEFRDELRQKVGSTLFSLMFTNQPFTMWTTIYNQIDAL